MFSFFEFEFILSAVLKCLFYFDIISADIVYPRGEKLSIIHIAEMF